MPWSRENLPLTGFDIPILSQISLDAVESGSECQITAGSTATNSWAVGKYQWTLFDADSTDAQKP